MLVAAGLLTVDRDINAEEDGKKGTDDVITPGQGQHDTTRTISICIGNLHTHKRKHSRHAIRFFHRAATIT